MIELPEGARLVKKGEDRVDVWSQSTLIGEMSYSGWIVFRRIGRLWAMGYIDAGAWRVLNLVEGDVPVEIRGKLEDVV